MYRFLGLIAGFNRWLHCHRINDVGLDAMAMIFLPLFCLVAGIFAVAGDSLAVWAAFIACTTIYLLLAVSFFRHDLVFQPDDAVPPVDQSVGHTASMVKNAAGDRKPAAFRTSGKFVLWEGDRSRWAVAVL
jgi:hypothetical protein